MSQSLEQSVVCCCARLQQSNRRPSTFFLRTCTEDSVQVLSRFGTKTHPPTHEEVEFFFVPHVVGQPTLHHGVKVGGPRFSLGFLSSRVGNQLDPFFWGGGVYIPLIKTCEEEKMRRHDERATFPDWTSRKQRGAQAVRARRPDSRTTSGLRQCWALILPDHHQQCQHPSHNTHPEP